MRGKGLARLDLELLHGIHEFKFVFGILLLEGGRIDPSATLFLDPALGGRAMRWGLDGRLGGGLRLATVPNLPALVKQGVGGKLAGIE